MSTLVCTLPTASLRERLAPLVGERVELHEWNWQQSSGLDHIDLAVLPYMAPATTLDALADENVTAVQSQALGYDKADEHLPAGVALANAVGVHEAATAELTLALVLAAQRDLVAHVQAMPEGRWNQVFSPGLYGRTVLVVGVGGVGDAIRRLLEAFGATVVRTASRARSDEHGPIGGPEDLPSLLGRADVVILATPLTEQTHHLMDAAMLARLKNGALLVNIGRGPLVDTDALAEATAAGRIRAALDVVDPEPLPSDHPLWRTPGVLITPHIGGRVTTMEERVVELVASQLARLLAGQEIEHRVL